MAIEESGLEQASRQAGMAFTKRAHDCFFASGCEVKPRCDRSRCRRQDVFVMRCRDSVEFLIDSESTALVTQTSNGFEQDMSTVAAFIDRAIHAKDDTSARAKIREEVREFAKRFPMPH